MSMWKIRLAAFMMLLVGMGVGFLVYRGTEGQNPFRLGLDLRGGSHLVYVADTSGIEPSDLKDSLESVRDVIERRINLFGVSEPNVQTEENRFGTGGKTEHRLIVELPGVTDVEEAIEMIGRTPLLEFKTEIPEGDEKETILARYREFEEKYNRGEELLPEEIAFLEESSIYTASSLTGRYLKRASLQFDPTTREPVIAISFDSEGAKLFEEITTENVGKTVAIYLDGFPLSTPVVNEPISGGEAIISGSFTPEEAKILVGRLNSGALPVPILLASTQIIGPSLGENAVNAGIIAGLYGIALVAVFLVLWYRVPGLIAAIALAIYISLMLALFKFLPVTLTAAGIAGFILSIGIAVDANVLIFERVKEELREGKHLHDAIRAGFARAWLSIRDANLSSLISAIILFWFGTSLIQGFALTFGIGVLVSMLSAISVSRVFLLAVAPTHTTRFGRIIFGSGFSSGSIEKDIA
jgi:preprotein translocase subunit SecD